MSLPLLRSLVTPKLAKRSPNLSTQFRAVHQATMKEAIISKGPTVTIKDTPIPKAGPGQVVIKTIFSGSNPKDWKRPEYLPGNDRNEGDDIAGTIHSLGANVSGYGLKTGDRVAAFHEMGTPGGSYAEYSVAWASTTFPLPDETSFEAGAAIPLAALTSAVGLYARLGLPEPWLPVPEGTEIPLVVYGGASAVGSYAIQLAQRSNIHPIIAVAGKGAKHVEGLINRGKGDTIVDYREGDAAVVKGIKDALGGKKLLYAFDAVSEKGSYVNICQVLEHKGGKITLVLPGRKYEEIPEEVEKSTTTVGSVHGDLKDFGYVHSRYISKGLQEGWFKPQPQEVVPGGLEGVQGALQNLKDGKASAVKYVFRIADTPGAGAS